MNGETHQYYPVLYRNTTPVAQPKKPEEGYHVTEDLVDDAIAWLNQVNATNPKKPWFLFLDRRHSWSASHAQGVSREVSGHVRRRLGHVCVETFARQKQMSIIPASAKLTPRPMDPPGHPRPLPQPPPPRQAT